MPPGRSFKTDESFLDKLAIGVAGSRAVMAALELRKHKPIELDRSKSLKVWKDVKIKALRVPDVLCVQCDRRVESRAKTNMALSMSDSTVEGRNWDAGLRQDDFVGFVRCENDGSGLLGWHASGQVEFARVGDLSKVKPKTSGRKGVQEASETWVTWPSAIAESDGKVDSIGDGSMHYTADGKKRRVQLKRREATLKALVKSGDTFSRGRVLAAAVHLVNGWDCPADKTSQYYLDVLQSSHDRVDRYAAVRALGVFPSQEAATRAFAGLMSDADEHIFVRVEAAASLVRGPDPQTRTDACAFLEEVLGSYVPADRLEAVIVLSEVMRPESERLLLRTLEDGTQQAEIRAGAAWALGQQRARTALPSLVAVSASPELTIRVEACRALLQLARDDPSGLVSELAIASPDQRKGLAWALVNAHNYSADQLLALPSSDGNLLSWVLYLAGAGEEGAMSKVATELSKRYAGADLATDAFRTVTQHNWTRDLQEY